MTNAIKGWLDLTARSACFFHSGLYYNNVHLILGCKYTLDHKSMGISLINNQLRFMGGSLPFTYTFSCRVAPMINVSTFVIWEL